MRTFPRPLWAALALFCLGAPLHGAQPSNTSNRGNSSSPAQSGADSPDQVNKEADELVGDLLRKSGGGSTFDVTKIDGYGNLDKEQKNLAQDLGTAISDLEQVKSSGDKQALAAAEKKVVVSYTALNQSGASGDRFAENVLRSVSVGGGSSGQGGTNSGGGNPANAPGGQNGIVTNPLGGLGVASDLAQALPNSSAAQENLAQALLASGDYQGALERARKAAELDSSNAAAYATMAKADYGLGDYANAGKDARAALERDPNDAGSAAVLKFADGRSGPTQDSPVGTGAPLIGFSAGGQSPGRGASGDPARPSADDKYRSDRLARDAESYRKSGMLDEAMRKANQALSMDPANVAALYERALAHLLNRQLAEALQDVEAALKLQPNNDKLLVARANILNRMKQYAEALDASKQALSINPKNADAYFNQAWALGALGRRKEAIQSLADAARLNDNYARQYREALALPEDTDLMEIFESRASAAPRASKPPSGRDGFIWAVGGCLVLLLLALGLTRPGASAWSNIWAGILDRRRSPKVGQLDRSRWLAGEDVGSVIAGTYNVIRARGEDSIGKAYEAEDRVLERKVEIKKLRKEIRSNMAERENFLREARAAAALSHPHIVGLYSVIEEGAHVLLTRRFMEGESLAQAMGAGPMGLEKAMDALRGLCAALEHAHAHNVLHRDLKPTHILFDEEGRALIADFGVAWAAKDSLARLLPGYAEKMWSAYAAPEEQQGSSCKASDVYSLAACFYSMLTARSPFGGSAQRMLIDKLDKRYVPLSRLATGLPSGLDEALARGLEPDPKLRVQSAAEFLRAVESALRASPVDP